MPDFDRLRSMLGDEDTLAQSNAVPESDSFAEAYPQYNQFLENARDNLIQRRLPNYVDNIPYSISSGNAPISSQPSALDNAVLSQPTSNSTKEFLTNLHNKNSYLSDPRTHIDRTGINEQIVDDYVKAVHPEMIQNQNASYKEYKSLVDPNDHPRLKELEYPELAMYQQQIARELSGVDQAHQPSYQINPGIVRQNEIGNFHPKDNSVQVASPFDFSPAAHEFLHAADKLKGMSSGGDEKLFDLKNESPLSDAMVRGNNRHIHQWLDQQPPRTIQNSGPVTMEPPGESAAYFNKIQQILANTGRR